MRRQGGFTLIELIVLVLVLAVFSSIMVQLFSTTVRAQRDAYQRDATMKRLDVVLMTLRRDAWAATSIEGNGAEVRLGSGAGIVTWRVTDEGLVRSLADGAGAQTWSGLPAMAFSSRGALLTVTLKAGGRDESMTMISQRMQGGSR
jgi:type II secretory pathway pseudopilin PulG